MDQSHILVVDDEATLRMMMKRALEAEGFVVTTATNGADALQRLPSPLPDALVLDYQMPVMDGWTLLEQLADRGIVLPTLVVSAYTSMQTARPPVIVCGWLAKPFDLDAFVFAVVRLIETTARSGDKST